MLCHVKLKIFQCLIKHLAGFIRIFSYTISLEAGGFMSSRQGTVLQLQLVQALVACISPVTICTQLSAPDKRTASDVWAF